MNKIYIPKRENKYTKVLFRARNIFCFVVFHFLVAVKNVFAAVAGFVDFVVSDSGHLCPRKLQNRQNERQRQKHFKRQHKNEKRQNKKCFKLLIVVIFEYNVFVFLFSRLIYPRSQQMNN